MGSIRRVDAFGELDTYDEFDGFAEFDGVDRFDRKPSSIEPGTLGRSRETTGVSSPDIHDRIVSQPPREVR